MEAAARALREKIQAEEVLEESKRLRSTAVIYEGHEFVTRAFIDEEWNKSTARRFSKWVQSFSDIPRAWQKIIDQDSGKEFTEIKGKSLVLLNPDEVWENGQVMLKRRSHKNGPWRAFRVSPIRPFLRKHEGCI